MQLRWRQHLDRRRYSPMSEIIQFGAFIVLCGLTHLLNVFTYEPHSFLLMLSLTISKFFTALVSFATAITLLTLIPQLLRIKVRENFLRIKARELDREVGMMKMQEETSWHVRMLTQEIRKSLDRHTILYTTLVELSNTLGLQNCAVWMPSEDKKKMNLTHELRPRIPSNLYSQSISIDDPDVLEIKEAKGVKILRPDSMLASASGEGSAIEPGPVAAIRMPMLKVSNFKGGTPEIIQTHYAILVLVLPGGNCRHWSSHELEIVEVVADQVAVALSHAAVLEESQLMRDKLEEQNRALLREKENVLMASEARNSFQNVISQGMRRPIHSILGLLSMLQQDKLNPEQRLIVNTMSKTGGVVSTLINDVMEISTINNERLTLEPRSFRLHSMIKEAASVARCLCDCRGFGFGFQVENVVPDRVVGDEKRIFQVILHIVANLLNGSDEGFVAFRVCSYNEDKDRLDQRWMPWKSNLSDGYPCVKFEIAIKKPENSDSSSLVQLAWWPNSEAFDMGLSFSMCKKIVQMMQGNIWAIPNPQGTPETIILILHFQLQPLTPLSELGGGGSLDHQNHHQIASTPQFKGLRVLLADDDVVNRAVTRKLLEKLGCYVTSVSSGIQCLGSLGSFGTPPFQLIILDLNMPGMDGFEVALKIRKLRNGSWPAILALTASAEDGVWGKCLQSGMNGLIRKPVVLHSMREELYRVLHNT
ncbi:uncharacterized protein A4U43_C04F18260 [Asparagus officinalis]|uniref:histidine kinase n=1 Tax=Asparagus officinalis TaxID=4686 RepID=A0A5P1F2E3_ASPOF|nr:uncharacterized protein A4U43_C04F18260 [Asparagus officinalis]